MDKKTKLESNHTRELLGQSMSLFSTSLFGGVPGAQSTAPSMMLYQEGGSHKLTKLCLAFFCVAIMFVSPFLLPFLPSAVFAGIILKVALDIADLTAFRTILKKKNKLWILQLAIVIGTILSTVLISLNLAVVFFTVFFIFYNKLFPTKHSIPDLKPLTEQEGLIDEI
jgi:MFS superfamily sulfate permease-like transporter